MDAIPRFAASDIEAEKESNMVIDRHEYSSYDMELIEGVDYEEYNSDTEEITLTLKQLKGLLETSYEDGRLEN